MSADHHQLLRIGALGVKSAALDQHLTAAIAELKPAEQRTVAMPVTLPKPLATGAFFSLVDACEGSERRLDELALPLHDEMRELEMLAEIIVTEKRDGVARARDYLDRLRGNVKKLEATKTPGTGDNGGPPTEPGSAASPPPSSDAPPSPPASSDTPPAPAEPHGDAGA